MISGTIDEQTLVTSATTPDFATGSFSFTDVDFNDKHTVTVSFSPADAVWSGASENNLSIPQQTLTDLATAFTAAATHDSFFEQTGTVTWTASLPDQDLDFLAEGETLTVTYDVTINDGNGGSATEPVMITFDGANDEPQVTGGTTSGSIGEDLAPTNLVVNGGFEDGSTGWTGVGFFGTSSGAPHAGAEAAILTVDTRPIPIPDSSYTQTISTVAGQGYLLSFWADAISFPSALEVDWNGTQVAAVSLSTAGYQEYFVALTGNGNPEDLSFVARSLPGLPGPQPGAQIDDVSLQAIGSTPTTQSTSGTIAFADPDLNDTHTVETPVAEGTGYLGTFTAGPVTEAGGSGTVAWQFTVDGADIQYLAQGQELKQLYDLTIDDGHGGSATQTVEVDLFGTNDAPVFTGGATSGTIDEISLVTHSTAIDLRPRASSPSPTRTSPTGTRQPRPTWTARRFGRARQRRTSRSRRRPLPTSRAQ